MQEGGGKRIGVSVMIQDMPSKEKSCEHNRPSVEDQVRARLDKIDDGCASEVDFLVLKRLQESLRKMPPKPRVVNLIKMIEPAMKKFGYYF